MNDDTRDTLNTAVGDTRQPAPSGSRKSAGQNDPGSHDQSAAPGLAYINGRFCDIREARVSVEDRGFQFADGVYEVLAATERRIFELSAHLDRLRRSLAGIHLPVDVDGLELPTLIDEGVSRCGCDDVLIYLQITRGPAPRDHVYGDAAPPTIVLTFRPKPIIDSTLRERGVALETADDIRWSRCDLKTLALLPNVMLKNAARRRGMFDAILVGPDGTARETTCANLFIARDGVVRTHPADNHILGGITRGWLLRHADSLGITIREQRFDVARLLSADEVFISSTTIDVMPVTHVDGACIGDGRPGPVARRLARSVSQAK